MAVNSNRRSEYMSGVSTDPATNSDPDDDSTQGADFFPSRLGKPVREWSTDDVQEWLVKVGYGQYAHLFSRRHKIDGEVLLSLTDNDLRSPPLALSILGDIKRMQALIDLLRRRESCRFSESVSGLRTPTTPDSLCFSCRHWAATPVDFGGEFEGERQRLRTAPICSPTGTYPQNQDQWYKVVVTGFYLWLVICMTAISMTVVHGRVPDMDTYQPLPDIILDNVPRIPWAFQLTELIAIIMAGVFVLIIIFHRRRVLILCRFNVLVGTVFLLRCLTLVVTSLSVPGRHLDCKPRLYRTAKDLLYQALEIAMGFGMSLTGVNTCGDYMFSGHTAALTLLNFFISEYTPRRLRTLHIAMWVANSFGIFLILAAHEHYTIDVMIAFVISSRMFLYYHMLAKSIVLDGRVREWFPMFTYVEEGVTGIVQNDYEVPSFQSVFLTSISWLSSR